MMKAKRRASNSNEFLSISQAAVKMRIGRPTMQQIVADLPSAGKRRGHPTFDARVIEDAVREWKARRDTPETTRLQTARMKLRLLELDVAERESSTISREEINARVQSAAARMRAILVQRIGTELPATLLQGLPADQVRDVCTGTVNAVLAEMSELGRGWDATA